MLTVEGGVLQTKLVRPRHGLLTMKIFEGSPKN